MKTHIISIGSQQGVVEFQSETPAEQDILLKMRQMQPLTGDEDFNLMHWVNSALAKQGKRGYQVVGVGGGASYRFNFQLVKEGPGLVSW